MYRLRVLLGLALLAGALPARAAPHEVELTWMSIANWYFKFDDLRIVMDGYITRVPQKVFVASEKFPADQFAFTNAPCASTTPCPPEAGWTTSSPDTATSITLTTPRRGRR
jgi:hypothetical protein